MTTLRQIVVDAFRESGLVQLGVAPDADEFDEGFRKLLTIIDGLYGYEMGDPLTTIMYGDNGVTNSFGRQEDRERDIDSAYLPSNIRLVANVSTAKTVYLSPNPKDGDRLSVIDSSGNFSSNNLTVNGNGHKIEGATSVTLSTDSLVRDWFYRADLGQWVRVSPLTENSQNPFPSKFDELLIVSTAMRLHPRHDQPTAQETIQAYREGLRKFRAMYKGGTEMGIEDALIRLSSRTDVNAYDLPSQLSFDLGRTIYR